MSQSNKRKSKTLETSFEREELTNPNLDISNEIDPNQNISNEINSGGGEPVKLEAHLVFVCPNVEDQIQQLFLHCIAAHNNFDEFEEIQSESSINLKKQRLNNNKPGLKKYFSQTAEILSEKQINSINYSLLKAFVVCGVLFSLIEHPFFINALKNLCPSYQPPLREVLQANY
ncbi:10106_t:CDS:2 [Gigaspora rosea]|nr:10106_t:CDS:2 [Gigaspora rosea]